VRLTLNILPTVFFLIHPLPRVQAAVPVSFVPVCPGLAYARLFETNHPWSIHIARMDRATPALHILTTHAGDRISAISPVSVQSRLASLRGYEPLAAVNGDFFVIARGPYQGDPAGIEITRGELISAPHGPSFWIAGSDLNIGEVKSKMVVVWPDGTKSRLSLNEAPRPDAVTLFTHSFGASTHTSNTLEAALHFELGQDRILRPNRVYSATITETITNGNARLDAHPFVIAIGAAQPQAAIFAASHAKLKVDTRCSENLDTVQEAIGGAPILLRHGNQGAGAGDFVSDKKEKPDTIVRHPRTALGFNKQYFYLVVVDGRQPGLSIGMSFGELAAFMKGLGCEDALNLDGGGSSTFWLKGILKNSPSDKHERSVANALVIGRKTEK
jgi:hypothetical protein